MNYADGMRTREQRAAELLGTYTVKTAAGLLVPAVRKEVPGWLYANSSTFIFLADAPVSSILGGSPGLLDPYTVKVTLPRKSVKVTAPMLVPAGIIDFGGGLEFAGQKMHIKALAALAGR